MCKANIGHVGKWMKESWSWKSYNNLLNIIICIIPIWQYQEKSNAVLVISVPLDWSGDMK